MTRKASPSTPDSAINALIESIRSRSEATDRFIAENTAAQRENVKAIAQIGSKVDKLTERTDNLAASTERLERSVSSLVTSINSMVAESSAQRETINNLIKLATALVERQAAS